MIQLKSISDLYEFFQLGKSKHPLVAVLDFSKMNHPQQEHLKITTDFYSIMFKNYCKNSFKYGRKTIDFQEGNLICIAPNQMIEIDSDEEERPDKMGWGLFFHPDLIRNTSLIHHFNQYTFFNYDIAEALHVSDKEKTILKECIDKIENEILENIDQHSQFIIVSAIELLLNYCQRYYQRQFITRTSENTQLISKVLEVLNHYYSLPLTSVQNIPTVKYLAQQIHLSSSYLSDLIKKETGKNAQEYIHHYILEKAKQELLHTEKSVNEIAYELGFEYPQYFNKLFKQKVGKTPLEYRASQN
ncbi:MAG: helix-turn-helix transcriptional regulator [Chitinophagales bacterium]|jgi:AraC-like DNA-binding protein|nr:helix-turn-helix transcriptional regulator [Chitinophagales bacterium]